jgi:hypothetical protein
MFRAVTLNLGAVLEMFFALELFFTSLFLRVVPGLVILNEI